MTADYLVSFDTDRIKDYVFATDKLREVRGASLLLRELNEPAAMASIIHTVCGDDFEPVYFAGGSGAALVPQGKVSAVIEAVEETYRQRTVVASITGAAVPFVPDTPDSSFGKRMEAAASALRKCKDAKAQRYAATIEPYTQPCAACERHPAMSVSPDDSLPLCEACNCKRQTFAAWERQHPKEPDDLSTIGEGARPPNYIGFIYADGNNIGNLLSQVKHLEDYRHFATELDAIIRQVVAEAVAKYSTGPYAELLIGGDDLMLVTTGDGAFPIALDIAHRFERESAVLLERAKVNNDTKQLTLGIGVVLAHDHLPMAAFRQLADQLCKSAKQCCAREDYQTSAIDFMVVTAAGSSSLKTIRTEALSEQAFVFPHLNLRARLTHRPYRLLEADVLLRHTRAFKRQDFPTSQLHFLYEGIFHSLGEAAHRWRTVAGRVSNRHQTLMEDFRKQFGADTRPPWRRDYVEGQPEYVAAFSDLVEIYPFAQRAWEDVNAA